MDVEIKESSGKYGTFNGTSWTKSRRNHVLSLSEMSYTVRERQGPWWRGACFRTLQTKQILNDVTLNLKGGLITAVLGSSGSGKTSLLDVISNRVSGDVSGRIYFNDTLCTPEMMRARCSYVMQADRLLPNLTVRETMIYTAYLKLPGSATDHDIRKKVQQVIVQMGLRNVAESRIGSHVNRGISGGEKRRVSIAIQLLQDPDILLLDEPTTGLDSNTARTLVMSLVGLAHKDGKIVLLTIHQPRSDIFQLLDQIAILAQGELTFLGRNKELVSHFTDLGYPCPKYSNPLDTYIDVSSIDRRNPSLETKTRQRVKKLTAAYRNSQLCQKVRDEVSETLHKRSRGVSKRSWNRQGASWCRAVSTLLRRMTLNLTRDKQGFFNKIILMPAFVIFIVAFLGRLKNNQESIQDRAGALYQAVTVPSYAAVINTAALFPCIREIYYRERRDGLYSIVTFLVAYTLHMLPFTILATLLFTSPLYWAIGMSADANKFGMYVAVVLLLYFAGEFLLVATMGVFMDPQLVVSTTTFMFTASIVLSSGFLRSIPNLPKPMEYLGYVSVHKYSSEIVAVNEYINLNLTCDTTSQYVPCMYREGEQYLEQMFPGAVNNTDRNFMVLTGFSLLFTGLAYLAFKIRGIPNLQ